MISKEKLVRLRGAAPALPPPVDDVAAELLDEIDRLEAEVERLRPGPSAYLSALDEAPREDLLSEVARQKARAESAEARLAALEIEARACTAEYHCGVCLALRGEA